MSYGSGRRASSKRPSSSDDAGDWMLSYSDLLSLLFAFMAILLSVSTIDVSKMDRLSSSISGTFSGEERITALEQVREDVEDALLESGFMSEAEIATTARGLEITLRSGVLFAPASANLSAEAREIIETIAFPIMALPLTMEVEGHTDAVPIRSKRYPSNWELSGARASEVVRALIGNGFEPERLKAVGLAATRPPEELDGESKRDFLARQRRVTLILVPQAEDEFVVELDIEGDSEEE